MNTSEQLTSITLPSELCHPKASLRLLRVITAAAFILFTGWLVLSISRAIQGEAELLRYRSTMRDLSITLRAMRAQALAKQRTVQLRVDASRGLFQVTSIQAGLRPYATLEHTIWLPEGLQISDAPPVLLALPTGTLSSASIVVTAPSYNRLFRLTTDAAGVIRLDEEPTL
jgi:hypothetical protein